MSSGESPPTYYFSGITFNPDFYTGTTGTYLTATTGKKHFLSYPTAQGTETISTLYSSKLDSSSGSTAFNFLESQTLSALQPPLHLPHELIRAANRAFLNHNQAPGAGAR